MLRFGSKFKFSKKRSRSNLNSQVKKRNLISLYTHFQKFITIKKNHTNKKTHILIPLYFIKKEQAISYAL